MYMPAEPGCTAAAADAEGEAERSTGRGWEAEATGAAADAELVATAADAKALPRGQGDCPGDGGAGEGAMPRSVSRYAGGTCPQQIPDEPLADV